VIKEQSNILSVLFPPSSILLFNLGTFVTVAAAYNTKKTSGARQDKTCQN